MTRKNPENKPLRIVHDNQPIDHDVGHVGHYAVTLSNLAIAEAQLIRAGKDSAMPHFIAIVKEIERFYGFRFEQSDD